MARKKREYSPQFTAFWDAWSGRNAGADKTRSADTWDAAAFTDQTVERILREAGSVPPDAAPTAWLRAIANEAAGSEPEITDIQISENEPDDDAAAVQAAAEPDPEDQKEAAGPEPEVIDIQISENKAPADADDSATTKTDGRDARAESQTAQAHQTELPQAPLTVTKRRRGRPKKTEPTIAVMLHIRPETRAWLKRQAFETERTMSEIVDALVAAAGAGSERPSGQGDD